MTRKFLFFGARYPLKVSINWRLKKNFQVVQPKLDFLIVPKGKTSGDKKYNQVLKYLKQGGGLYFKLFKTNRVKKFETE